MKMYPGMVGYLDVSRNQVEGNVETQKAKLFPSGADILKYILSA